MPRMIELPRNATGGERLSREDWLAHGLATIGRGGPDAVRLDALCKALGVTKGSFYWHFKSRADFLAAAFEAWEARETDAIIETVEGKGGGPRAKLEALYAEALSGRVYFGTELAIRHWARHDPAAQAAVKRVDARRIGYMEWLLAEAGLNAAEARLRAGVIYDLILGEALALRAETAPERAKRRMAAFRLALDGAVAAAD